MSTNDVRDILDIKPSGPRPSKKGKPAPRQPDYIPKELANLLGERTAPVVLQPTDHYKKRFTVTRKVKPWEWQSFDNPCRNDDLKLKHWAKKSTASTTPATPAESRTDDAKASPETYYFAKYNYASAVPTYTDAQYEQQLKSENWTKDETDYLFSLARDYDLRWILIDDRYDYQPPAPSPETDLQSALVVVAKPRTMEELKARYYHVAAKTILLTHPQAQMTEAEFDNHERMAKFDPERERRRKEIALSLMSRSPEEIKEEEILLAELRRIVANEEKFLEDRKELYNRLDHPIAQAATTMYETSSGLQQLVQNLYYSDKTKNKRKSLVSGETSSPAQAQSTPTAARSQGRDVPTSATADKKKGSGSHALRTLTSVEEKRFGVSTHDRLNSGVSFRSSRVDKLILAKSQIQSAKLQDAIRELAIPLRPRMPTIAVCGEYEKLITSIHLLLDARKLCEKVNNEIRIVKVQKGIGQEDDSNEGGEGKADEDIDADGEADEAETQQNARKDADSDGEEANEEESKLEQDEDDEEDKNESEDEEPTKATIESDNEDVDRPLMPGDNDNDNDDEEEEEIEDEEDEEEDDDAASPESPPADEDDDDDEDADAGAEEEDDESNHPPQSNAAAHDIDDDEEGDEEEDRPSSRASVARSIKSARSGRIATAASTTTIGNKHKRSASALSVSESEKSTGTRTSKRARK